MARVKRSMLPAALLAMLLLGTGCADIRVTCGIEPGNIAVLRYDCRFDPSGLRPQDIEPARRALAQAKDHFLSQGFMVSADDDSEREWTMSAFRSQPCETPGEAVDALNGWLTDGSLSPFATASLQRTETPYEEAYYICLTLDLTGVLSGNDPAEMPPDIENMYARGTGGFTGSLAVTLPGDEIIGSTGEVTIAGGQAQCRVPLGLDAPAAVMLQTGRQADSLNWRDRQSSLEKSVSDADRLLTAAAILSGVMGAVSLALGLRNRRNGKENGNEGV